MATAQYSSGLIGLGSRLFLGQETTWGTAVKGDPDATPNQLEIFNIYPQPGGRPQKTYASIEVPQLFPSMFRLKPLKGRTNVAGSFTFSLPKENLGTFLTLVTGDSGTVGSSNIAYVMKEVNNESWTIIQTLGVRQAARYTGMKANSMTLNVTTDSVVSFDLDFMGKDEEFSGDLGIAASETILDDWFEYPIGESDTIGHPFTISNGNITGILSQASLTGGTSTTTFDKFVDVYASTETTLRVARAADEKVVANTGVPNTSWESSDDFIIPFSDFSLTVNNALDFPAYINGTQDPNEPIPAGFKEITGSMTVPFNEHTDKFVSGLYDHETFKARLAFVNGNRSVFIDMPNFCLTGDGSPGSVPEGEITLPVTFGVYAGVDGSGFFDSSENIQFTVDESA
jgi:hypothetical protein